ncbi:hypothetical protein GLW04_19245 [Halobacillus litoralis]|uniref:Uncharacterized protein n=1 Tax=Halobacillus litoralis TaxID=45668 RepID=A0A845DWE2_9BACI|nr:hypothetical protein [Halobacillus litoralis]
MVLILSHFSNARLHEWMCSICKIYYQCSMKEE